MCGVSLQRHCSPSDWGVERRERSRRCVAEAAADTDACAADVAVAAVATAAASATAVIAAAFELAGAEAESPAENAAWAAVTPAGQCDARPQTCSEESWSSRKRSGRPHLAAIERT